MEISLLKTVDLSCVEACNSDAIEEHHWTQKKISECLAHGDYYAWKLLVKNEIVAYSLINIAGDEAHIMYIAVHPEHRKKGYGYHLLKNILLKIEYLNKRSLILEVNENNRAAIGLYEKTGFQKIGLRKKYYHIKNKSEDALVYELKISKNNE